MTPGIAEYLEHLNIHLMAETRGYCIFARGNLVAMAHRSDDGQFRSIGSSGMMTDNGLAYLVWRGTSPVLASHGSVEASATPEQVEAIRQFSSDLKSALGLSQ